MILLYAVKTALLYQLSSLADDHYFLCITYRERRRSAWIHGLPGVYRSAIGNALVQQSPVLAPSFIEEPDGTKISKSAGQSAVSLLQETRPSMIIRSFGEWMGWDTEKYQTLQDMINHLISHPDNKYHSSGKCPRTKTIKNYLPRSHTSSASH